MKDRESEFLNNLFAGTPDETGKSEADFPLVEVPEKLTENLYAITESTANSSPSIKQRVTASWPKITSIAASVLVAIVLFQVYQQQQTLKQLEQAQADLATALHYLGEANKITRAQMINSLNTNVRKATVTSVIDISREAVLPTLKPLGKDTTTTRTL